VIKKYQGIYKNKVRDHTTILMYEGSFNQNIICSYNSL